MNLLEPFETFWLNREPMPRTVTPLDLKGPFHLGARSLKMITTPRANQDSGAVMALSSPMPQTRYYTREGRAFRIHRDKNRLLTADVWVNGKGIVEADPVAVIYASREVGKRHYQFLIARCEIKGFFPRLLSSLCGWFKR
jgi:hypothetical protein